MTSAQQSSPSKEHSHLGVQPDSDNATATSFKSEDTLCPGCGTSAIREEGGLVVAFGQSFFHVDCFRCAKCNEKVTADTNLLLLSDGSPVCANCTYCCTICQQAINDEAIMAGDDSFHAHCFKCKICKNRINELTYARTSHGIYCMECHNDRVARNRRHAQKKAEMAAVSSIVSGAYGNGSSKVKDAEVKKSYQDSERSRLNGPSHQTSSRPFDHDTVNVIVENRSQKQRGMEKHIKLKANQYVSDAFFPPERILMDVASHSPGSQQLPSPVTSSADVALHSVSLDRGSPSPLKQKTLPVPPFFAGEVNNGRRRSFDDGVRPLNMLIEENAEAVDKSGLTVDVLLHEVNRDVALRTQPTDVYHSPNPAAIVDSNTTPLPPLSPPYPTSPAADDRPTCSLLQAQSPLQVNPLATSTLNDLLHNSQLSRSPILKPSWDISDDDTIVPKSSLVADKDSECDGNRIAPLSSPVDHSKQKVQIWNLPSGKPLLSQRSFDSSSVPSSYSGSEIHRRSLRANTTSLDPSAASGSHSLSRYRVDAPHQVQTEVDSEINSNIRIRVGAEERQSPQVQPWDGKDTEDFVSESVDFEVDVSTASHDSISDIESQSITRTSHATYIAPALPPIRFSMNSADFSELLSSVSGVPPFRSLEPLNKISKQSVDSAVPQATPVSADDGVNGTKVKIVDGNDNDVDMNMKVDLFAESNLPSHRSSSSSGTDQATVRNSYAPIYAFSEATERAHGSQGESGIVVSTSVTGEHFNSVLMHLKDLLRETNGHGAYQLSLDRKLIDAVVKSWEAQQAEYSRLKTRFDGIKRTSKQYIEGLTVAQAEYDRESKARRDAEAEVAHLRILLSGQTAQLTALSHDSKRQEQRQKSVKDIHDNLLELENDLSKLRVERDIIIAEMEQLSTDRSSNAFLADPIGSLSQRMEILSSQYQRDLIPLKQERESLSRETADLTATRDALLEETISLNTRNEELAALNQQSLRRGESTPARNSDPARRSQEKGRLQPQNHQTANVVLPSSTFIVSPPFVMHEDDIKNNRSQRIDGDAATPSKKFKWPGYRGKDTPQVQTVVDSTKVKARLEHNFTHISILRFTRCDHCGDKLWGSQLRCTFCNMSVHVRCIANVHAPCTQHETPMKDERLTSPQSMFGRDLAEQAAVDSVGVDRVIPVIVEKCIEAVEASALDYEGIYRKNGGAGQSRMIAQLFDRGDYAAFELRDSERFTDICSVTSVLKNYFRSLPVPLLTLDMHEEFISAVQIRDPATRDQALQELVNKLPCIHYHTLRMLMLHLHNVHERSDNNRMNARNLGVVFGPTLMRSRYPDAEFSDMAGKALCIEWLVENALSIFTDTNVTK
ncbi:hypothetical protein AX17_005702 [Amanita inopinata Kibby_2008]|nr:hypothetical protein AX17_005702 [Amanita inopinata Kibby_2008]